MDKQNKKPALSAGLMIVISLSLAAVFLIYRIIGFSSVLPESAFFASSSAKTVFFVIFAFVMLCQAVTVFLADDKEKTVAFADKSVILGIGCLVAGIAVVYDSVSSFGASPAAVAVSPAQNLITSGKLTTVVGPVFGIAGGLMLLADAVSYITGKGFVSKIALPHLFIVFRFLFITLGFFSVNSAYMNISDLFLSIFANAFFMIFVFEFARAASGIGAKGIGKAFYFTGFAAFTLFLALGVTGLVFSDTGKIPEYCAPKIYYLPALVFIVSALYSAASREGDSAAEKEEEPAEAEKE